MRILRAALIFALATAGFADIITLRNGRVINGIYLGGTASQMQLQVGDNVETVNVADVARIEFRGSEASSRNSPAPTLRRSPNIMRPDDDAGPMVTSPTASASSGDGRPTLRRAAGASTPDPQPAAQVNTATANTSGDDGRPTLRRAPGASAPDQPAAQAATGDAPTPAANAPAPAPIEIPANTSFIVRTIEAIDSDNAKEGQTFAASLDSPIVVNGSVVIPRGADVVLKILDEKQGGRISGKASLTVALWQVKVRGKMVDVNTQNIERDSASRTGKTAKTAGGGAALGAIVGAVVGGGKGAAIGAGAGAAGGTAATAMTHGERVRIPPESVLTFVLDSSLTI
jgi:hypothetical protein